jgi:hypothetical protein
MEPSPERQGRSALLVPWLWQKISASPWNLFPFPLLLDEQAATKNAPANRGVSSSGK